MLKSKKFYLVVILLIVSNIATAVTFMLLSREIVSLHRLSIAFEYNEKKCKDTLLLLSAIHREIKKDPEQAVVKIEKLQKEIPLTYEGFSTEKALKQAGFQ
ncbi:MAG: hypothetical protein IKA79_02010 [Lentisphaeria bacterium]|nr:hypothetical protein [Lentisphaeria bacterium]